MGEIHDPVYIEVDGERVCKVCGYPELLPAIYKETE